MKTKKLILKETAAKCILWTIVISTFVGFAIMACKFGVPKY